jgi:DNA topoisomerase VI subunit B
VQVNDHGITVTDNGPGLPAATVAKVLDFTVGVSSREVYAAPDRGAQGNALKTVLMMPFVLDGREGHIEIDALGTHHTITVAVDSIRQKPVVDHQ